MADSADLLVLDSPLAASQGHQLDMGTDYCKLEMVHFPLSVELLELAVCVFHAQYRGLY